MERESIISQLYDKDRIFDFVVMQMAPAVAAILAEERGMDDTWRTIQLKDFNRIVSHYILNE